MTQVEEAVGALRCLKSAGLSGKGAIALFLTKRVLPLHFPALRMYEMTRSKAPWTGTAWTPHDPTQQEVEAGVRFLTSGPFSFPLRNHPEPYLASDVTR